MDIISEIVQIPALDKSTLREEKKKILSWLAKEEIRSLENFGKVMKLYYEDKPELLKAINKKDKKRILEG
mgnify:CR=1 FL=1